VPQGRVPAGDDARVARLIARSILTASGRRLSFLRSPSPGSTSADLISQIVIDLCVYGSAFLGKFRADNEVVQLGCLPPDQVTVDQRGQRIRLHAAPRRRSSPIAAASWPRTRRAGAPGRSCARSATPRCRADYAIEDGERIFCGLDVGAARSATALVWATEDLRVGVRTWEGEEAAIYAEAALRELAERYLIVEAAFDPWRFGAQALDLSAAGLRMVQFPQHDARLVPATERCSAAILERRLKHPGDPVLDAHVHAAIAKQTARGARIAQAGGRHPSNRIDAVIALAMAVDRGENRPEPVQLLGWL
jgi:hypothetical protein